MKRYEVVVKNVLGAEIGEEIPEYIIIILHADELVVHSGSLLFIKDNSYVTAIGCGDWHAVQEKPEEV